MPSVAGIFPIGTTGENFVVAEWHPDPKEIQAQLLKLAVNVENQAEPLAAAREAFIYDTSLHFETESDPYGRAWTPLEDNYLKRKLAEGDEGNILHRTGALEHAATSQEAWIVTERDILFDFSKLPPYGPYHQAGTMDPGVQKILHTIRTGGTLGPESAGVDITREGRGGALPQRMYIGADEDTIAEVEDIFLKWLDKLVREDCPPIPVMPTGFYIGGEYPIMRFLTTGQPLLRTPFGPRFGRMQ